MQEKLSGVPRARELARIIHPLNAASNIHFFVSVSKARKETFGVTAPLIATAGVAGNRRSEIAPGLSDR